MTTARRILPLAAIVGAALAAGGCSDPYANDQHADRPATAAQHERTTGPVDGELPGRIPPSAQRALDQPQAPPARSAEAAVRAYAAAATTWTAKTVAARYRQLARQAVGQARRDAQQTAASAAGDAELSAGAASSRGNVRGLLTDGASCFLVVVEQRITPGAGDRARVQFTVYHACARAVEGGWAVERFEQP